MLIPQASRRRRRRGGGLGEIKAIQHVIRRGVALVDTWEIEGLFTKPEQADVGLLRFADITLAGIGAEHQAANPCSQAKLSAIRPFLQERRINMVTPSAPIVPGDEYGGIGPQTTLNNRIDLADGPIHAIRDISARMFAQGIRVIRDFRSIHPGYGWQLSGSRIDRKLRRSFV